MTNIDFEPLAIERGQQLEREVFGDVRTNYIVADARDLSLGEKHRIALDKGTADAIACGGSDAVVSMGHSIRRCLEDDGFWVSLSYSPARFEELQSLFEVQVISRIPTPKARPTDPDIFHYCYLLRPKRQP